MNVQARVPGVLATLAIAFALGCGGGATLDAGDTDTPVPADVLADVSGSDAEPDLARDLGPVDPGLDAPADVTDDDVPPADLPADLLSGDDGPGDPGVNPCPRLPAAADRDRFVVTSFPYQDAQGKASDWALIRLSAKGVLSDLGPRFQMGPAFDGDVAFTPDGQVGIAVQDDGTLGVFRIDPVAGSAVVVHAGFAGGFSASRVLMGPEGDHALVLDTEWRDASGATDRGGGVYRVDIGCDGTLTDRGMVMPAKLPAALLRIPTRPDRVVLAARDVLGVLTGGDLHLLSWGNPPVVRHSVQTLGDDSNVDGFAITPDGRYVLQGDTGMFATHGVAVAEVVGETLVPRQFLTPIGNPAAIVVAPAGGTVLVAGAYEPDDLWILDRTDATPETPFTIRGPVDYVGGGSQLPTAMVMLDRGPLAGRVLVTEVEGIRQVDLKPDGTVQDLGIFTLGGGTTGMPAALGVQP